MSINNNPIRLPPHTLIVDVAGHALSEREKVRISHPAVAGVILFSRNFESSKQLKQLVTEIRAVTFPEFVISVDHEGGRVQRFRDDEFTHLPSMGELVAQVVNKTDGWRSLVQDIGWLMASECIAHGINLSFAPVLDIEGGSDVIGDRAFSDNPDTVSSVAQQFIAGMKEAGLLSVGKHFPGHGSTKLDSHIHTPIDERPIKQIVSIDRKPFDTLIGRRELDSIMPAHIVFSAVDNLPVGYSKTWLKTILRKELQFIGAIFSDDLSMVGAGLSVEEPIPYPERVQKALAAGCDFALVCNKPDEVDALLSNAIVIGPEEDSGLSQFGNAFLKMARLPEKAKLSNDLKTSPRYEKTKLLISKIRMNKAC